MRRPLSPAARLAPLALAAVGCAVYLALDLRPVDLAASEFRAHLFDDHGFTLWNGNWYAGHYTLTYSVLAPPLTALAGSVAVEIGATLASAVLFARIALRHFGPRAWLGTVWFGLAAATLVFHGRVAFALGVALGLAATAALQSERTKTAIALAALTGLASPVAGLFLAIAGAAAALADRRKDAFAAGAAAIVPAVLLAVAFPDDGRQVYRAWELWLLLGTAGVVALAAGYRERTIQTGAAIYAAVGVAAYAVHSPLGNNVVRLATLFGGPLVACTLANRRLPRAALPVAAVALAALAWFQWKPVADDVTKVEDDPATNASYYRPLLAFLDRNPGPYRTEIPFTRAHWEAAEVGRHHALARGWQRQLDVARNPIFYGSPLTATTYQRWLRDNAVRFVALPDATVDESSDRERALIEGGLPYLRPAWRSEHWRVFAVTTPHALVTPTPPAAMQAASLDLDTIEIDVRRPGSALVRTRWSPYWKPSAGCVERAGDWTRLTATRPGRIRLRIAFALGHGRRCAGG